MSKNVIGKSIQLVLVAVFLGGLMFPSAFAQTDSKGSNANKINPTEIQKALTEAGFYKGAIDGVIGSKTRSAIRTFQEKHGLTVDGVCGPKTWEKLKAYLEEAQEMDVTQDQAAPSLEAPVDAGPATELTPEPQPENTDLKQKLVS